MSADVLRPGPVAGGGSKLGELIGRLHEYLATSTEDQNEPALPGHWTELLRRRNTIVSKPAIVTKHSGVNESDTSSESGADEVISIHSSDHDTNILPKGTIILLPEPVSNEVRDEFRGPEFRSRRLQKQQRDQTDRRRGGLENERVNCTACGQQSCFKYYMSDDISKDSEGMDEQCRWCAEGGSLIGCDYCSNAFCKKCVLRNMGRKELSTIMEEERKWDCYVCTPEPLVDLVLACDSVLENLELTQKRNSRHDPNSVRGKGCKGGRGAGMIGIGGKLTASEGLFQRMQRFVDLTTSLSHSFRAVIESGKEEEGLLERIGQLQMFRAVLNDLQAANRALQEAMDHELTGSKSKDSKKKAKTKREILPQSHDVAKELLVKLDPAPASPKPILPLANDETSGEVKGETPEETGTKLEIVENMELVDATEEETQIENYCDQEVEEDNEEDQTDSKGLTLSEENKRSPRVKTTPRRRRTSATPSGDNAGSVEDDSDSDEVPEVLLQTAAVMRNSKGEADEGNRQVRKQRLFGLVKTTPPDRSSRKRTLKERSSSSSSSSSGSSRRGLQNQGSMVRRTRGRKCKVARMAEQGGSSSSEAGGPELESVASSDSDDQRIKPLTEDVMLLGSGNFQQSSGDEMNIQPGPSMSVEDDDLENSIAREILLARIRANSSDSELDSSSDDQSENTKEEKSKAVSPEKTDGEDNNGSESPAAKSRPQPCHRLLRHGLTLSETETKTQRKQESKNNTSKKILECVVVSSTDETSNSDFWDELSVSECEQRGSPLGKEMCTPEKTTADECLSSTPRGRRQIRAVLKDAQLAKETQSALKEEEERRMRLAEREKLRLEAESRKQEDVEEEVILVSANRITPLVLEQDDVTQNPLVQVHTHFLSKLKPHQKEGVRFMWDCCCESIQTLKASPGSGCILAHCMGLGKTLQVIVFLHTVLLNKELPLKTALIVCPLNTVLNWKSEFEQWQRGLGPNVLQVSEVATLKSVTVRVQLLSEWFQNGGVMIMGYESFRILTHTTSAKYSKHKVALRSMLLDPGPDLVVCDEGHILRNSESSISKATRALRTRRRIILTGTPLQNNLTEYHCMVNFIKENLLGSLKEFHNRFINPIENGQCADSTPADVRLMKNRSHVLHQMMTGFIQRRDFSVLMACLPPKREYVLSIRMMPLQCRLYDHYLQTYTGKGAYATSLFQDLNGKADSTALGGSLVDLPAKPSGFKSNDVQRTDVVENTHPVGTVSGSSHNPETIKTATARREADWYLPFVTAADARVLEHSGKLKLLLEILQWAEELQEKVLVFSQSLITLDLIEDFLLYAVETRGKDICPYKGKKSWVKNRDYYRLDGKTNASGRKRCAQEFNDTKNIRGRLFLISTRAGCLGINLVAANRVVVFDACWNPSYDIQSIFRAYRFGQKKTVSVYRFLAQGTMEQKIYERQVAKQSLSFRVLDQQQIQRHFTHSQLHELYSFQPDLQPSQHTETPADEVLSRLLESCGQLIVNYHEHNSLLDHREEEELSEEERRAAWDEYRAEKTASVAKPSEAGSNQELQASVPKPSAAEPKTVNPELQASLCKPYNAGPRTIKKTSVHKSYAPGSNTVKKASVHKPCEAGHRKIKKVLQDPKPSEAETKMLNPKLQNAGASRVSVPGMPSFSVMLLAACFRRFTRCLHWIPVTVIIVVVVWSYYAYVVHFCWMAFLCTFHVSFGMFLWSFWKALSTAPSSPSLEFQLPSSDSLLYNFERGGVEKSQVLVEISQKLPVHTRTAAGAIRYCHHCQLIKPDRCHHCSVCQKCVLKMDHHCPWLNNCVGFSNYKFFLLLLLYSLLYCLLIISSVTPTFIQLWQGKMFDSCVKLHVLFLMLVSIIFAFTVCVLLVFHIWLLLCNKTTLEWLSVPFFVDGPGSEAFDVGVRANLSQVFGKKKRLWLFPVFSRWQDSLHTLPVMNGDGQCPMEENVGRLYYHSRALMILK
ncbi:hypothetical protein DNTS_016491, partial [Danionella cerebrum]